MGFPEARKPNGCAHYVWLAQRRAHREPVLVAVSLTNQGLGRRRTLMPKGCSNARTIENTWVYVRTRGLEK